MSNWTDSFQPVVSLNKAIVDAATWGHLFPDVGKEGYIVCTKTIYGCYEVIDEAIGIEGSPWWFESINDFISEFLDNTEPGNIYKVWIKTGIRKTEEGKCITIAETKHQLIYKANNTEKE